MQVLVLLSGVTATNGKPSSSTSGVAVRRGSHSVEGFSDYVEKARFIAWSKSGTGTVAFTLRFWGYIASLQTDDGELTVDEWFPLGTGTDASKGQLDAASSMGETSTDQVTHTEVLEQLAMFDRVYAEVEIISGTGTEVYAALVRR